MEDRRDPCYYSHCDGNMTHNDVIAEVNQAIAMADALHGQDPLEKRRQQREAERQERRHARPILKIGGGSRSAIKGG